MPNIKKYADPKEKYMVYKKKKPQIRMSTEERDLLYKLRESPEILRSLINNKDDLEKVVSTLKSGVHSIDEVVSTNKSKNYIPRKPLSQIDLTGHGLGDVELEVLKTIPYDKMIMTKDIQKTIKMDHRDISGIISKILIPMGFIKSNTNKKNSPNKAYQRIK